jgi:ribonuclease P protein component
LQGQATGRMNGRTGVLERRSSEETMTERHRDCGGKSPQRRPKPRLKRRSEFLAVAKGKRFQSPSFSLQAARRLQGPAGEGEAEAAPRFGFTGTKKIGGAVVRNRIRRRLKEALRLARDLPARPGYDYVIVARLKALREDFCALQDELGRAFAGIHQSGRSAHGKDKVRSRASGVAATRQEHPVEKADE